MPSSGIAGGRHAPQPPRPAPASDRKLRQNPSRIRGGRPGKRKPVSQRTPTTTDPQPSATRQTRKALHGRQALRKLLIPVRKAGAPRRSDFPTSQTVRADRHSVQGGRKGQGKEFPRVNVYVYAIFFLSVHVGLRTGRCGPDKGHRPSGLNRQLLASPWSGPGKADAVIHPKDSQKKDGVRGIPSPAFLVPHRNTAWLTSAAHANARRRGVSIVRPRNPLEYFWLV